MRWWFSFGWLSRAWENRRKHRRPRRWVKYLRPVLEPLEERRLFTNNVWLPLQLAAFDGTIQTTLAMPLFQPATTTVLPQLGLQNTSVTASGQFQLTDNGSYDLSVTESGDWELTSGIGTNQQTETGTYFFSESGTVCFSLTELGTISAAGFSITNVTLTQTATLSYVLVETNSLGSSVLDAGGTTQLTNVGTGAAPFDPFFPQGFNWLSLTQQLINSLTTATLTDGSVTVTETNGSETYDAQVTGGVLTVQGTVNQPTSDSVLEDGQDSYTDTAVAQFDSTKAGSDSFSLSELGSYGGNAYSFSSVSYQESGTQSSQWNGTVTDSRNGTATESGMQSFSGNNHSLNDSSSDSFQFNNVNTLSYGESVTSNYTLTEQGSYGGGSFNLNSLTYNIANGSGGYSLTQTSLQTQTGTFSDSGNDSGTDSYGIAGTLTGNDTSTSTGNFTTTLTGTLTDDESGNFTLSESGAYGNASWSLSSYSLSESLSGTFSQQQLGTTTQSGNDTTTDSGNGGDSFLLNFGSTNTTTGGGTLNSTDTSTDTITDLSTSSSNQSGTSSTTLSEAGAFQNGIVNLSSFVFTSGQSGTGSASSGANETDIGSGQDTASGSDCATDSASNGSFQGDAVGTDSYSASDSFSFTSTDSSSESDSGTFSQNVYQAGVYNSGSWALSSVSKSSDQNDNWSATNYDSSTDSGTDTSSDSNGDQGNNTVQFGVDSVTGGSGDTFSDSDSGTFVDTSNDTITDGGFSQFTLTQLGSFGNFSFSYGTVSYQSTGTSNDTTQDSEDDNFSDTVNDSVTDNGNQSATACFVNSTDTGSANATDTSDINSFLTGLDTLTETITASDSFNLTETGSFLGGMWKFSNISIGDSSTDSFSDQDLDSSTDSGTDCVSANDSGTSGDTNVYAGGSETDSGNSTDTVNSSDTFTDHNHDTVTDGGGDSFSLTEQGGSFSNFSFAFTSVVYQGGDTISDTETDASNDTSVGAETNSYTGNDTVNGLGTYAYGGDSNTDSGGDSGSDTLTTAGSDSMSETATSSESDSFYESGQYSGGSLALSLVSYGSSGSDTFSSQSSDTSTDSGTLSDNGNANASDALVLSGTLKGGDSGNLTALFTQTGNESDTSYDSLSVSGSDTWGLTEVGSYGNFSYSFSNFVAQGGGSDNETVSESATDSFNGTLSDNNSSGDSQSNSDAVGVENQSDQGGASSGGNDSFSDSDLGQSNDTVFSSDGWHDYQAGSFSGNSWNLNSVSETSSGSGTWTDTGNDTVTLSGLETILASLSFGGGETVTGDGSESDNGSASGSSSETLGGTDTSTSSDSSSGGGSDSWSQTLLGIYNNESFAFTSVVEQSGDSFSDSVSDDATDTFQGSLNSGSGDNTGDSGSDGVDVGNGSGGVQVNDNGSVNDSETIDSQDTLTGGDSETWSDYQAGSYSGGSFAFSNINYQDGGSDSSTETDLSTFNGTFTGSANNSLSASGGIGETSSFFQNTSANASSTGSSSGTDSGSNSLTISQSETWNISEVGSYANDSYNLSSYVSSSSDSSTSNSVQTDSISETITAAGSMGASNAGHNLADASGTYNSYPNGTFAASMEDSQSDSNGGSFTETMTVTQTVTNTQTNTFSESSYQAGVYSAGSYNLSSATSSQSSTDCTSIQGSDTYIASETLQDQSSSYADQNDGGTLYYPYGGSGSFGDGFSVSSSDTSTGQETLTGGDTWTEQNRFTNSLYQAGSFSNDSYSLSSYSLSQSGGNTVTTNSADSFTATASGTSLGTDMAYAGTGSFSRGDGGSDSAAATQTDSWSLTELGSVSGGSLALSCFVFAEQQNSTSTSSDSDGWSESYTGNNQGDTYSGSDSGSEAATQSTNSTASVLEQGAYGNGSLALSLFSFAGSGGEVGNASDSDSGSWSGQSYSGNDSDGATTGDSANWSESATGSFSNGSWSLSSYVLQGTSTDYLSSQANVTAEFPNNGPSQGTGTSAPTLSRDDTADSQDTDSYYQSGAMTAGEYANVSYNVDDSATVTVSMALSDGPTDYWANDTWQASATLVGTLSGATLSTSASLTFQDSHDGDVLSGNGTSGGSSSPSWSVPGLGLNLASPDSSMVPVLGTDGSGGAMGVSSPNAGAVEATSEWLSGTVQTAQEAVQPDSGMPMVPPAPGSSATQSPVPLAYIEGRASTAVSLQPYNPASGDAQVQLCDASAEVDPPPPPPQLSAADQKKLDEINSQLDDLSKKYQALADKIKSGAIRFSSDKNGKITSSTPYALEDFLKLYDSNQKLSVDRQDIFRRNNLGSQYTKHPAEAAIQFDNVLGVLRSNNSLVQATGGPANAALAGRRINDGTRLANTDPFAIAAAQRDRERAAGVSEGMIWGEAIIMPGGGFDTVMIPLGCVAGVLEAKANLPADDSIIFVVPPGAGPPQKAPASVASVTPIAPRGVPSRQVPLSDVERLAGEQAGRTYDCNQAAKQMFDKLPEGTAATREAGGHVWNLVNTDHGLRYVDTSGFTLRLAREKELTEWVRRLEQNPVLTPEEWQTLTQQLGLQ